MPPETRRLRLAILMALLLLAPFGEGGAGAAALFLNQSLVALAWSLLLLAREENRHLPTPIIAAVGGFLLLAVISGSLSGYPYAAFLRILDLVTFVALLFLAGGERWESEEKERIADALLASSSLQSLLVIVSFVRGTLAATVASLGLLNPNHEAAYLLLGALVTLPRVLQRPSGAPRLARGAALLVTMMGFFLLMSRGALLGLLAASVLLVSFRAALGWHVGRRSVALLLGTILLACAAGVAARFWRSEDPYRYQRAQIWQSDLRTFSQSPLLGVGPGTFRHVAQRQNFPLAGPVRFGRSFQTPHSDLLGILVETGVLGLGAALFAFAAVLRTLASKGSREGGVAFGVLLGCAGIAAQGLVEDLSTRPAILTSLAILIGVALAVREAGGPQPALGRSRWRAWVAVGGLAFSWYLACVRPFLAHRSDAAMRRATAYAAMEVGFQEAIWRNPYQAPTYLYPATLFLAAQPRPNLTVDLYARFRRDLDRGITMNRESADARLALARLEASAFRDLFQDAPAMDRSIEAYRAAVRLAPHDPRIRVELGGFLHDVRRGAESARQMVLALHEEPMYLSARYLLSRLHLESGDPQAALSEFRKAEEIRATLASYKPDSAYARDICRDPASLRHTLETQLPGE